MASSVEALAEAFEGALRELRRLRRHLKGFEASSTDLQIQFLKLPLRYLPEGLLTDCLNISNMQAGWRPSIKPCSPILPFRYTCKRFLLSKLCIFAKGHCSNLIFGAVFTLAFLGFQKVVLPVQYDIIWHIQLNFFVYSSIPAHSCGFLPMAAICMHQLVNLPILCNMQSNVLNDLAKAKRRWTEKNPA